MACDAVKSDRVTRTDSVERVNSPWPALKRARGLVLACVALVAGGATASAQGKLVAIDFQDDPPFAMTWTGGSADLKEVTPPGPKGPGVLWQFRHFAKGGWNDRGFVRYTWWDWNVSRAGHQADQAGWTQAGSRFRPSGGWLPDAPYYLRFRIRVQSPIVPMVRNDQCDGDTQMKFFMWNNFTGRGTDRMIMMLHAGSEGGGDDQQHTTIDVRAGVSGSAARTRIPNREWVHVQVAWRWGAEGTGYQRIYINNNRLDKPTAENREFNDLDADGVSDTWAPGGPTNLDNQFFLGGISNTGSCVRADADLDLMDFELATSFDPTWYPVP